MPALSSNALLHPLISRDANTTKTLEVVCAWPVSGQYGPGTRFLYYVLVAACVIAQRAEWLRQACLAGALLFPAVAAFHGIVLAALHIDGAVDMDVYGAFQLCSIGVLAAPATVRLSRTYFFDPGRNIIFLWTILVLTGLLSLTVEFYRTKTSPCPGVPPVAKQFPFDDPPTCGLVCNITAGPYSPLRNGSTNNIYVIPEPERLTFGTATLLAAACCIPAILSLVSMWNKILQINWKARFGSGNADERLDELIEGTNGATIGRMRGVNDMIRLFLSVVEAPVFSAAILAILILGEENFWSVQVYYQTEPMSSIGQWAPLVGTGLAALGSLYLLLAGRNEAAKTTANPNQNQYNYLRNQLTPEKNPNSHIRPHGTDSPSSTDGQVVEGNAHDMTAQDPITFPEAHQVTSRHSISSSHSVRAVQTLPTSPNDQMRAPERSKTVDLGSRRKVAKALMTVSQKLGTAHRDWYDDSEFKSGKALDFPEIPGEEHRNRDLPQIREVYNPRRDSAGNATPVPESRSRASSLHRNVTSGIDAGEGSSTPPTVRRATLEVPAPVHHSPPIRYNSSNSWITRGPYSRKEQKEGDG